MLLNRQQFKESLLKGSEPLAVLEYEAQLTARQGSIRRQLLLRHWNLPSQASDCCALLSVVSTDDAISEEGALCCDILYCCSNDHDVLVRHLLVRSAGIRQLVSGRGSLQHFQLEDRLQGGLGDERGDRCAQ